MSVLESETFHRLPSTIDLRGEIIEVRPRDDSDDDAASSRETTQRRPRAPRMPPGVRVRRVRLGSVAKIAAVFSTVGAAAVLGALAAFWAVVQQLGIVDDIERLAVQSLGLETFTVDGQRLFELSAIGVAGIFGMGFVITLLLTLVYNASCSLFGGVALEFGPLRHRKRVFSPKHRRFISL
ncbi:MAG: DUF3566 domain-containing protein [Acidimicrobiales bacterium]|nr:DUF3566 domain-containing protein [Acidimicrobiales bacterium]